jgi:hypothetical protein
MAALDRWSGRMVALRVVTQHDDLVAVFRGELGERSDEKHPAVFWPLLLSTPHGCTKQAERPGVYLHPDQFEEGAAHIGGSVLEFRQSGITLNIRRV